MGLNVKNSSMITIEGVTIKTNANSVIGKVSTSSTGSGAEGSGFSHKTIFEGFKNVEIELPNDPPGNTSLNFTLDKASGVTINGQKDEINASLNIINSKGVVYNGNNESSSVFAGNSENITINTGKAKDWISSNKVNGLTINAGDGNNSIKDYNSTNIDIKSGIGKDSITLNKTETANIFAGQGTNKIKTIDASGITVDGSTGVNKITNVRGGNIDLVNSENNNKNSFNQKDYNGFFDYIGHLFK